MTRRTCTVDGCERPHHARGFCNTHRPVARRTNRRLLTDADIAILADLEIGDHQAAEMIGRTVESVRTARRRHGFRDTQPRDEMVAERLEDLAWLADTGENAVGAARRLGVSHDALDRWCRRHCFDLWQQLRARDPKPLDQMAAATVEARRKVDA